MCSEVAWAEGDGERFCRLLSPSCREKRTSMPNYTSIVEFFTELEWESLLSERVSSAAKRELVLSRAVKLGCRCPSEPTLKRFTALCLVVSGESDGPSAQKHVSLLQLKALWKQLYRRLAPPPSFVVKLPISAEELERCHPEVFVEVLAR